MRVITGTARGRKLIAPEGLDVRPTKDSVKEAIFSAIQFETEGSVVLDLFSGSGQLGIEAVSRGAKKAYLVDSSQNSPIICNTHAAEKSKKYGKTALTFYRKPQTEDEE